MRNATIVVLILGLVHLGDASTQAVGDSEGREQTAVVQGASSDPIDISAVLDVCQSGCAYESVQQAINAALPGDVIRVAQGTYFETLVINKNVTVKGGYDGPPMWQRSPLAYRTVLDGSNGGSVVRIINVSPTLDGFVITRGKGAFLVGGGGVYTFGQQASPIINGNVIVSNSAGDGGGIFVDDYASPTISNNVIVGNEATSNGAGIYVDWRSRPRIVNNTIAGNTLGFGGQGVFTYNNPTPTIRNNIIISQRVGVQRFSGTLVLDHNDVWNNTFNYIGVTPGEQSLSVDPLFELGADNYHLQPGSPVIDQGTMNGAPPADFEGDPRPVGGGVDIGADESGTITFEPDLVEAACSDPPPFTSFGSKFPITDTTSNVGLGSAGESTTRYYFSLDDAKSADDFRLGGARNVPPLPPGSSWSGTAAVTVPRGTKPGSYKLLCCADDSGAMAEAEEGNNCRASVFPSEMTTP
jgi:parallel beta-helix repeat protein